MFSKAWVSRDVEYSKIGKIKSVFDWIIESLSKISEITGKNFEIKWEKSSSIIINFFINSKRYSLRNIIDVVILSYSSFLIIWSIQIRVKLGILPTFLFKRNLKEYIKCLDTINGSWVICWKNWLEIWEYISLGKTWSFKILFKTNKTLMID